MIYNFPRREKKQEEFRETWVFDFDRWDYLSLTPSFSAQIDFECNGKRYSEFKVVQE